MINSTSLQKLNEFTNNQKQPKSQIKIIKIFDNKHIYKNLDKFCRKSTLNKNSSFKITLKSKYLINYVIVTFHQRQKGENKKNFFFCSLFICCFIFLKF